MNWIKRLITRLAWWWINRYDNHTTDAELVSMSPLGDFMTHTIMIYDKSAQTTPTKDKPK